MQDFERKNRKVQMKRSSSMALTMKLGTKKNKTDLVKAITNSSNK
jgi:hypothetical protein